MSAGENETRQERISGFISFLNHYLRLIIGPNDLLKNFQDELLYL